MRATRWTLAAALAAAVLAGGCATEGKGPTGHLASTENLARIQSGKTTGKEVEQLLGAPYARQRDAGRGLEWWEYQVRDSLRRITVWVGVGGDGVVREVMQRREKYNPGQA
jgi:hypothetical protein